MNYKRLVITIIMLLLLSFAIYKQLEIIRLIKHNSAMLDADPFAYGAIKFGIGEAACFISDFKTLVFNQSGSKFIILQKSPGYDINIAQLNGVVGDGSGKDS